MTSNPRLESLILNFINNPTNKNTANFLKYAAAHNRIYPNGPQKRTSAWNQEKKREIAFQRAIKSPLPQIVQLKRSQMVPMNIKAIPKGKPSKGNKSGAKSKVYSRVKQTIRLLGKKSGVKTYKVKSTW